MPLVFDDEVTDTLPAEGRLVFDDEPQKAEGRLVFDDEEQTAAPATVEAPLQTPIETGARSAAKSFMDTIFSPIAGMGGIRQEISNAIGDTAAGVPKAVFDALTVVPRTIRPIAQEMVDMSRDYFRPDTQLNPKSAVVGGALGQAPLMLAGGMANAAVPLIAGGFSGAGSGLEMADEMGLTNPAARLGLAAAYGGVEGIVERAGGFGNKAAMDALQAGARQGAGAVAGQALKSTITEGGEELVTGAAQDSLAANFAPNTYDTSRLNPFTPDMEINPDYVARRGYEALGGAVGGAFFGGAQMLMDRGKAQPTIEGVSDPLAAVAATFTPAAPVAEQSSVTQTPTATPTPTDAQPVPFSPVLQDDLTTIPTTEGDLTTDFAPLQQVTMAPRFRDPNELDPVEVGAGNAFVGLPRTDAAQAEARIYEEKMARFRSAKTMSESKHPIIPNSPYGGQDILDLINANPIKLPPKSERKEGEYNWEEKLDIDPKYKRYLFSSRRGSNITALADLAYEQNLISEPSADALMAEIESIARQRDDYQREMDAQEQRLQEMEAAAGGKLESPTAIAWADSVIDSSMETPFIGIDPTLMAAYTVKGAQLIREGFTAFTEWSAEMIRQFGEKVRDYLQGVWHAATKTSERGSIGGDPLNTRGRGNATASADGAAQSSEPSPGGLSDAEVQAEQSYRRELKTLVERKLNRDPDVPSLLTRDEWLDVDSELTEDEILQKQAEDQFEFDQYKRDFERQAEPYALLEAADILARAIGFTRSGMSNVSEATYWNLPDYDLRLRLAAHDVVNPISGYQTISLDSRDWVTIADVRDALLDAKKQIIESQVNHDSLTGSRAQSGTSGFKNLDTSGTTAGYLNADILAEAADLIRKGITNFADWSRAMVTRFGQRIRDYLQDVWRLSEGGFVGTGLIPKANTSVFEVAAKPLRSSPANLSREDGSGAGNGWNAERQMSQNAVRALDLGKLMEPDFKIWLADEMGIPEAAITKAVLSAANQNAQNLYREYHHVGKKADIMEFYDPREIALAPKFFLGAAKALKTKSHQQAARKAALKAWQTIREDLAASGQLGVWSFAETTTNKGGVLDQLDPQFKRRVENGELTVPQAIEEDRLLIIERGQSKSKHLLQQEAKTLSELEAKRDRGQGNDRTLRQIEAAQDRQIKLQERIDSEIAEQLKNHPSNKMPAPVSQGRQVESNARFEGATAPTRTEDVRLTDRATGATSDSQASVSGEPKASTSGFKNLDTSGTTAGFLNAEILAEAAALIRQGITNFADWSRAMVIRFGQRIRDYLQDIWRLSEGGFAGTGGSPLNNNAPTAEDTDWSAPRTDPVLLTHAAEAERLASEGKLPGPTGNQGTVEGWQAEALNRMQQPGAGQALLTDIINSARAHTAVEYFMLEVYAGQLDRQLDEASAVLENPLSNADERAQAAQQIIAGDIERDRVEIAARLSGSRAGAALGARRFSLERSIIPSLRKMIADVTLLEDPTGATPLAPETRAQVEKMHAEMTAKNAKLEDEKENGTGGAVETYNVELGKLLKEAQEQLAAEKAENARNRAILDEAMKPRPEPVRVSKGVGERIKTAADEARARMRARGIQFSANPMFDVEFIADAAVIMADNIRQGINGAIELVKAFGDEIKPFLNQIRDKAEIMIRDEAKRKSPEDIKAKAKQRVADGKGTPADLARQLALSHIADHLDRKDATMSAEKIAELVRADLQEIQPGITTRQARDLISGYGKSTTPSQEASKQVMRDYRAQMQKLTQIEALRAGEKLLKSGPQRDEPSPRQRELTKLLEELKRETGYQSRTREDELKGIRDRIKKGLENQIEDLKLILAGKAKPTSERERVAYDADLQALQTLRNKLKTLVEEMPQHKLATEERRNRAAKAAALASEAEWKRRAAAKEWNSKGKIQGPNTQDVQAAKDKAAAARADFIALKKAANPGYDPEARELEAFKRRLQKQINVLNERIAKEDLEAKKKTPRQRKHDEQSAKLEMELNESKRRFIDLKVKKRWERMGIVGKAVENSRRSLYFMRAIMTGGEFSAIGRQGILKALSHPVKFMGDLKAMVKAFKSAAGEQQLMSDLWKRENATNGIYKRSGLALHNPTDYSELLAEGAARSALSDKIPWFNHTARAYTGLLNNMRADMLDMLIEKRSRNGQEELSDSTLKALAEFVNDSTGSGKLGFGKHVLQGTARDVASAAMFSPSFFMSRLRLLTGASAWGADKRTVAVIGTEYAKIAAGYIALHALLGALQDAGEDELEKDARSGGFLKMDFGKTSVDLMAGLSQMAVFLTRMITGETKSRGEIVPIRGEKRKFNAPDVPGVIWRFMRSKESPQAGLILDALTGEDSLGNPVNFGKSDQWVRSAKEMVTPMTGRAIADILTEEPAPRSAALSAAAMIGIGTNTRKPATK